jgi:hypothetical protein
MGLSWPRKSASTHQGGPVRKTFNIHRVTPARLSSIGQINCDAIEGFLQEHRRTEEAGNHSDNHYILAFDEFCRWLIKIDRLAVNPISRLDHLNTELDVLHKRRSLTPTELTKLVKSAWTRNIIVQNYPRPAQAPCLLRFLYDGI